MCYFWALCGFSIFSAWKCAEVAHNGSKPCEVSLSLSFCMYELCDMVSPQIQNYTEAATGSEVRVRKDDEVGRGGIRVKKKKCE